MADLADRADEQHELSMETFQRSLLSRAEAECLETCEDCGEEIPQARREALKGQGCTLCIGCQEINDHRRAVLYG